MFKLNDKQRIAAQFLANGALCKDAAEKVGVTPETISHWKRSAEFVACYNQCCEDQKFAAMDRLRSSSIEAVDTLKALLSEGNPGETRRKAAVSILKVLGFGDPESFHTSTGSTNPDSLRKFQNLS